jgi:glycosyltransferase involved in cell wall biosynthesis
MPHGTNRVLFVNRSYYPDAEATGQLLTQLCEDLTDNFQVMVIAGQPNQNLQHVSFRRVGFDSHNGVTVRRVWHTQFSKASFVGRAVNYLSYLMTATIAGLTARRPDVVVVETDPPLLCLLGSLLKWRFRCKLVVYLQDIYPQLGVALGKLRDNWKTNLLQRLFAASYRNADRVVVLSEDMRDVMREADVDSRLVSVIPNWIDVGQVRPVKTNANSFRAQLGLDGKFVVMYSGNLGLCQGLENVLLAAEELRDRDNIAFVLVGDGASKPMLVESARQRDLQNVHFFDYQPASFLAHSLSAADLHLVPIDRRVSRFLMPSKLYGALASGTPVLTVAPEESELAQLVCRELVGTNVEPDEPELLAEKIVWFAEWCDDLAGYGERARLLAVESFDRPVGVGRFRHMLQGVIQPALLATPADSHLLPEDNETSLKGQTT